MTDHDANARPALRPRRSLRGRDRSTSFREARPAPPGAQPGDVRRLGRQRPHDGPLRPGAGRQRRGARRASSSRVSVWLWFTVLFANFAEAMAEGRGKAQAATLRAARRDVIARRSSTARRNGTSTRGATMPAVERSLRKGDVVLVEAGDVIPGDGEVIEGVASVDESAITGESAPVIREAGGDRSAVTGGTRVLSDWLVVRVTANPGETFLDRMIAMVEGARRQKTPERDRARHPARRR